MRFRLGALAGLTLAGPARGERWLWRALRQRNVAVLCHARRVALAGHPKLDLGCRPGEYGQRDRHGHDPGHSPPRESGITPVRMRRDSTLIQTHADLPAGPER